MLDNYDDVLTIKDLQSALKISRSTAYSIIASGIIPCIKIGKNIRIRKKDVLDFLAEPDYNNKRMVAVERICTNG